MKLNRLSFKTSASSSGGNNLKRSYDFSKLTRRAGTWYIPSLKISRTPKPTTSRGKILVFLSESELLKIRGKSGNAIKVKNSRPHDLNWQQDPCREASRILS